MSKDINPDVVLQNDSEKPIIYKVENLLPMIEKNGEGELPISHILKIKYNLQTGDVSVNSALPTPPGVNNTFEDENSYGIYVHPVEVAVGLIAKMRLLQALYELGDEKINKIIRSLHECDVNGNIAFEPNNVEYSLIKIQSLVTSANPSFLGANRSSFFAKKPVSPEQSNPIHLALGKALQDQAVSKINSLDMVANVIERLQVARNSIDTSAVHSINRDR